VCVHVRAFRVHVSGTALPVLRSPVCHRPRLLPACSPPARAPTPLPRGAASLAGHEQLAGDDLAAAAISYQHALRCDARHYPAL
jgi:hypothetical protein